MSERFHARFSALDRKYIYVLYDLSVVSPDPRAERYAYGVDRKLDIKAMQNAARILEGKHDFKAFTEELEKKTENTTRVLYRSRVSKSADSIFFTVRGTAFMRGMMRRMAGAILEVGLGKRSESELKKLLDPKVRDGLQWPVVLPAKGLTLMEVRYGPHPRDIRTVSTNEDIRNSEDLEEE